MRIVNNIILLCMILLSSDTAWSQVNLSDIFLEKWLKNEPITTSFRNASKLTELPDEFGNNQTYRPMHRKPRSITGGYVLTPGFYELRSQSYCIKAGTHAPSAGNGYLYAPLLGSKADIILTILTNSAEHPEVPQHQIQLLLWAIIARSDFRSMNADVVRTATTLITPVQLLRLNKKMILQSMLSTLNINKLPREIQFVFQAEDQIRQAFNQTQVAFQDIERLVMLSGSAPASNLEISAGRWSKHPDGYYVRYYPSGYSRTVIQAYVPEETKSVTFDAANHVSVPANTGAQRLALSNVPYDTTGYSPEEVSLGTNISTRQGAYEGTAKFPPGTVGFGVHQSIGAIQAILGSFGEAKIGDLFNRSDVQALLAKENTIENNRKVAELEYTYWQQVLNDNTDTAENRVGGVLGVTFNPTDRTILQMGIGGTVQTWDYTVNNYIDPAILKVRDGIQQVKIMAKYRIDLLNYYIIKR